MAEKPKHKIEAILLTNSIKILKIVHVKIKSIKKKLKTIYDMKIGTERNHLY